ncbi:EcsC family protein [Winogradskyella psychrotolerans]|uniref:EcsC family protein n=1 Tax=Winogradskyella psychrotolerans TaxID=1344585 RepID=UPI001C064D97|nr:EcsC family protein [Winogradskyella psychrotolerans]MBU2921546.1 EcsC family protein [Winogradskyella psychrotolerans]
MNLTTNTITPEDKEALGQAKYSMQNLGWAIRNVNKIGNTVETGINYVPEKVLVKVQKITESVLLKIIKANLLTIKKNQTFKKPSKNTYKSIVTGTGALSGFFGASTGLGTAIFASEVTITTKFLMRTIMDIARSEGEDIYSLEGQMACLQVFALGGDSVDDDGMEMSYYTTRMALNSALNNVSTAGIKMGLESLVKGASALGSNAVGNFLSKIATRLSLLISEKFLAQAVPVVGAIGGGGLNYVFVDHFQNMATAHFTIRRLERKYGEAEVKLVYEAINTEVKKN